MNWKQFWGICEHRWIEIGTADEERASTGVRTAKLYALRCEKCGDITSRRVGV